MDEEPFSDRIRPATLNPGAEYGNLPFDRFVLGQWDYSRPTEQDQDQWNQLAKKWLSMTHIERSPYWPVGALEGSPDPNEPWLPTQDQVQRVLAPHQTIHERNVCHLVATCVHPPIWVRTCFTADLAEAYNEIEGQAFGQGLRMFDEPTLYLDEKAVYESIGSDIGKLLLRLPSLADSVPYTDTPEKDELDYEVDLDQPEDESELPLWRAALKERSIIYLVDEEAVTERLIKILFLDVNGNVVWHNKIKPKHVNDFESRQTFVCYLFEHFARWSNYPTILQQPGALLAYSW